MHNTPTPFDDQGHVRNGARIALTGKVIGRAYTAPMKYDVVLACGIVLTGIPEDAVMALITPDQERDVFPGPVLVVDKPAQQ